MSETKSRLLVVDDNPNNRDLIHRRLSRAGYQVELAENGDQALERLDQETFDLIVLDVMMPGLSGTDVLKIVRRQYSPLELPIIMATAKDQSEDIVGALDLGANDYVTKPIDFPVLTARIHSHLKAAETARDAAVETVRLAFADLQPGLVIEDKYRLEEQIGSGNFGTVFRATHLAFDEPVALKVLKASVDETDQEDLRRFRQEGSSTMRLRHPHAVTIMDFLITGSLAILVMEMLDGESLDQALKNENRMSPTRTLEIALPICEVLAEADNLGIVHRDIKPANIFLNRTRRGEEIKVLDFGIAKIVDESVGAKNLTLDEGILGTPAYMSPERLHGHGYDGRADVYSLGIVIYQMLTGHLPFSVRGNDAMAMAVQHLTADPISLRHYLPDIPVQLEAVVMRTLKKDPAQRPTAAELALQLVEAMESGGIRLPASITQEVAPSSSPVDTATRRLDVTALRDDFDFGDLLEAPEDGGPGPVAHPPLPVQPPLRLGDAWSD